MVTLDLRAEVDMAVSCMRNASGHNYKNISVIVDLAMGQIPRFTERIFSFTNFFHKFQPSKFEAEMFLCYSLSYKLFARVDFH